MRSLQGIQNDLEDLKKKMMFGLIMENEEVKMLQKAIDDLEKYMREVEYV